MIPLPRLFGGIIDAFFEILALPPSLLSSSPLINTSSSGNNSLIQTLEQER